MQKVQDTNLYSPKGNVATAFSPKSNVLNNQNYYDSPKTNNLKEVNTNTNSTNPMFTSNSLGVNMKKFNMTNMQTMYSKGQSTFSNSSKYPITTFVSSSTLQTGSASYSIPKQKRFKNSYKEASCQSIYNLTDYKSKGITMPHSTRKDNFKKSESTPSSQDYVFTSVFDDNLKLKRGISISTKNSLKVNII